MGQATKRINFFIDDDVRMDLERLVPAGKRSRIINNALRSELNAIRRREAVERLLKRKPEGRTFLTAEITDALAKDRGREQ